MLSKKGRVICVYFISVFFLVSFLNLSNGLLAVDQTLIIFVHQCWDNFVQGLPAYLTPRAFLSNIIILLKDTWGYTFIPSNSVPPSSIIGLSTWMFSWRYFRSTKISKCRLNTKLTNLKVLIHYGFIALFHFIILALWLLIKYNND